MSGKRLFVGNLAFEFSGNELWQLFEEQGIAVTHVDRWYRGSYTCAVVDICRAADAAWAIKQLDDVKIYGRRISVRGDRDASQASDSVKATAEWHWGQEEWESDQAWGTPRGDATSHRAVGSSASTKGGRRIYIGNLPYRYGWKQVKDLCHDMGLSVRHADVLMDAKTQSSKGCAVVEFWGADDAPYAIEQLHGLEVEGRTLFVREDYHENVSKKRPWSAEQNGSSSAQDELAESGHDAGEESWPSTRGARHASAGVAELRARSDRHRSSPEEARGSRDGGERASRKTPARRILCENLPPTLKRWQLGEFFADYYTVEYANVINDGSDAFGVIQLSTWEEVADALSRFNGQRIDGTRIYMSKDDGQFDELREKWMKMRGGG